MALELESNCCLDFFSTVETFGDFRELLFRLRRRLLRFYILDLVWSSSFLMSDAFWTSAIIRWEFLVKRALISFLKSYSLNFYSLLRGYTKFSSFNSFNSLFCGSSHPSSFPLPLSSHFMSGSRVLFSLSPTTASLSSFHFL